MPYMKFVPQTTGQYVTGAMELDHLILWYRCGLGGIIAVVTGAFLLFLNDFIHKRNQTGAYTASHGTLASSPDCPERSG